MSPPKLCAVCGDKALGYNFNAVTCESCKAFFRRNALSNKQFTCPFNQNCEVTVVTRRFCQKCRLKKCLDIGMRSENIMSEEDKQIKRRKIETNRAKRRQNEHKDDAEPNSASADTKIDQAMPPDSSGSGCDPYAHSIDSCGSFDSASACQPSSTSSPLINICEPLRDVNPELMTGEEMVEFIVGDPDRASQAISKLMRTSAEAMFSLEKIINSQKDALKLIQHLIAYPGDALKIISKIMNSPFNALTVFTKFMSSPTDALEIISKIVSSPQDVLVFIKNLMDSPEEGLEIMNKFMNTPAEALKIINKIFNGNNSNETTETTAEEIIKTEQLQQTIMKSSTLLQQESVALTPSPTHAPELAAAMESPSSNSSNVTAAASSQLQTVPNVAPEHSIPLTSLYSNFDSSASTSPQLNTSQMAISPSNSLSDCNNISAYGMNAAELQLQPNNAITALNNPIDYVPAVDYSTPQANYKSLNYGSNQNVFAAAANDNVEAHQQASLSVFDSLNSLESVLSEVIRIEFQAFNNLPTENRVKQEQHMCSNNLTSPSRQSMQQYNDITSPASVIVGRGLNEPEQMKLRELKMASEALYHPVDNDLSVLMADDRIKAEESHQDPKLLQVVNLTAVAIKRLIKMAKKITAFRDMCQEDQVALLKGGCTEMMIMRSVMTYDDNCNAWKIPHTKEEMSNVRAEVLKLAKGNVYEEHLKFIRTFDEKWRMDENIILIMCAIVLFTPTRSRIIHSDVVRLEQNSYYYLLRRYLESVYPGCEAKSAFIKLIQKISDVERLNQFIIGVYLNVNPSQVEPLLREIFDIKNH